MRRAETGRPFYCAVLEGRSHLIVEGLDPLQLDAGDFVLIPAAREFSVSSTPSATSTAPTAYTLLTSGEVRLGNIDQLPDYRALVGYCVLGSPDASLLLSLLPSVILVRGDRRLSCLVELVTEEARAQRPGRDLLVERLLEVMFIEALRSTAALGASPGLLRGLADECISRSLRQIHASPEVPWTVEKLARNSALSRSTFFQRFQTLVGMPPMVYLTTWRMAIAKDLLRNGNENILDIAERCGYRSASSFSTAFKRHTGQSPAQYSKLKVS